MSLQFDRKPSLSSRFRRRMGRLPTSSWSNAEEEASGDNPPRGGVDYGVISGKVDLIEAIFNTSEEFHGDNTARGEKTFDSFEEMEELGIPPSDSAGGEWAAETSYSRRPPFFPAKPFKLPREEEDGARNIPLDGIKFPNLVKVGNSSSDALKKNKSQKMRRSEVAGDEGGLLRIGSGFFREMGNPQAEAEAEVKAVVELKEMIYRVSALRPVTLDPVGTEERTRRRNVRISSDPQTVAARQRRERISERLRVLRRLVPGGSKMDTASMLDEAANYLKFLKSQISALQSLDAARCPSSSSSSSSSSSPYSSSSSSSSSSSPSSCSSTFSLSHLSSNPFFATRGFPSKVQKGSNPFQPF